MRRPDRRAEQAEGQGAADGRRSEHLRPASPGENREPNRLPTSPDRPWLVVLRLYRPHREVVTAGWRFPGIRKVA